MKYTTSQIEKMIEGEKEKVNRVVCETMGKCWHEWNYEKRLESKKPDFYVTRRIDGCKKCGVKGLMENTDYTSSPEGVVEMMEWLRKQVDRPSQAEEFIDVVRYWIYNWDESPLNTILIFAVLKVGGKIKGGVR